MDTTDLYNYLLPFQKNGTFKGVYASDALPTRCVLPAAFAINLSPKRERGTHWVGLYIDEKGAAEYFDSYGFAPDNPNILRFLRMHSINLSYNKRHLSSVKCGKFVCIFIISKMYRKSFEELLDKLSNNLSVNDLVIENIFKYLKTCCTSTTTTTTTRTQ